MKNGWFFLFIKYVSDDIFVHLTSGETLCMNEVHCDCSFRGYEDALGMDVLCLRT